MKAFNVLTWDFNTDELVHYDVMPYFRIRYKEIVERSKKANKNIKAEDFVKYFKVPETLEEFKQFVKQESQYQFWARCEYEMICHGWPVQRDDYKLDIHEQIMMNIDIIAEILYNEL